MFERFTFESLIGSMLQNVSDDLDKREGSVIYDALAPAALEMANFYVALDMVVNEIFADTASYYYLIKRAAEKGIYPREETNAILKLEVVPADTPISINDRFNLEDELNYTVTSIIDAESGQYQVECETAGIIGNQQLGEVIPIDTENDLNDLESAILTEVLVPGEDEENVEDFRERYFASFRQQAFGGNKADYKEKVNEIEGVGACKIIREWKNGFNPADFVPSDDVTTWIQNQSAATVGEDVIEWLNAVHDAAKSKLLTIGGTVKIAFVTSEYKAPSSLLIEAVQNIMDPADTMGEGNGLAPIGHVVNVVGVAEIPINYAFTILYVNGYSFENMEAAINNVIDSYHEELCHDWAVNEATVIRINQIETLLLKLEGIKDVTHTEINNEAVNFVLNADEIPIRGTVSG